MKRIQSLIVFMVTAVICMGIVERATAQSKIYWTLNALYNYKIQRANVDGSEVEDLVVFTRTDRPTDLALDVKGGKMYWPSNQGTIRRANLDGTGVETLVSGLSYPESFALDVIAGRMYWIDSHVDKIQRANMDGSMVEDLVIFDCGGFISCDYGSGFMPSNIALDAPAGKMYWTDISDLDNFTISGGGVTGFDLNLRIRRTNLDGSDFEAVMTRESYHIPGLLHGQTSTLALDSCNDKVYWSHVVGDDGVGILLEYSARIQRANLDSSEPELLLLFRIKDNDHRSVIVEDLALDVVGGKMYWVEGGIIRRANLDGSGVEDLMTAGPGDAYQYIALDWTGAASGEASFRSNVLTIPVLQVGGTFYRVELNLLNSQTLEFGIRSAEIVNTQGTGCQSSFANNILTIPGVDIGEASYRAELTLVNDDPITFKILNP